ncbi:MAG: trypsin-like serine protease [Bacteroidota bacterium]
MSTSRTTLFGIIRHDVPLSQYREMGARPDFKCVGRYSISETAKAYAAGVLIAPRWVLTAAHFVQDSSVWKFGEHFYATKKIVKHPQRRPNAEETQWNGWDMALVELKKPVLDIIPAVRYRGNTELGKTITKLGYGFLGDGQRGLSSPRSQEKLGGQNVVDAIGGTFEGRRFSTNVMICDFDDPKNPGTNQWGSPIPLELEIGGSKGDSGGGVFMEENGKTVLVGIVSGALNRRIKYGSVMALARVSTASVWIDSVIGP